MTWAVITEIPDPLKSMGNLADAPEVYVLIEEGGPHDNYEGKRVNYLDFLVQNKHEFSEEMFRKLIRLQYPVFELGEILLIGPSGREVTMPGRKPSKWLVEYEEFNSVESAVARSEEIVKEAYA
jgi:hypothetical protein